MNTRTLFLIPAALALCAAKPADAYVGIGFNLALPLYYPPSGYYPAARPVVYQPTQAVGERVTPAPGPGYVWMAGHWNNVSQRWVWVAGHWDLPPSPSAIWTAGHWVQGSSGWVWVDGAWTIGAASPQSSAPPLPPGSPAGADLQPPGNEAPPSPPGAAVSTPSSPAPSGPEMADGTVVSYDPPSPVVEYVPVAPYPDSVWGGGFWGWNGAWYWNGGHYAARPFRGAAWVSGGWEHAGRGWAWHGGHWR